MPETMLNSPRQQSADLSLAGSHVTFRGPMPSRHWNCGAEICETNLCYCSRRSGCGRAVPGACVCRAGGGARFLAKPPPRFTA